MNQEIINDMDSALAKLEGALKRAGIDATREPVNDPMVQCCRCRNKHKESDRIAKPNPKWKGRIAVSTLVCPHCRCTSYYSIDEK